jgi:hypothetical protein
MANKPPLKDHKVTIERKGKEPKVLPISSPNRDAAKAVGDRIIKRRGWKGAKVTKVEEDES